MIIELDKSIKDFLEDNKTTLKVCSREIYALNHMAEAVSLGNHILMAEVDLIEYLMECKLLNETAKVVFNYMYKKIYIEPPLKHVLFHICVTSKNTKLDRKTDDKIIYVPLNYFYKINTSILFTENQTDSNFYIALGKKLLKEIDDYNELDFHLDSRQCGGSQMACIMEHQSSGSDLCLFIADSDKKNRESPYGGTAKQAKKMYVKKKEEFIIELLILNVREKENLIHPKGYLLCNLSFDKKILNVFLDGDENVWRYINVKDGIKLKDLEGINGAELKKKIELYHIEIQSTCMDDIILTGIGDKAANLFAKQILGNGLEEIFEREKGKPQVPELTKKEMAKKIETAKKIFLTLPEYLKTEWITIFKHLYTYGCCLTDPEIRV